MKKSIFSRKSLYVFFILLIIAQVANAATDLLTGATATPLLNPINIYENFPALAWEQNGGHRQWSLDLFASLDAQSEAFFQSAADMIQFCSRYAELTHEQQIVVWATLFVEVANFESGWMPTARFAEKDLGLDAVTKEPVVSEGLLQLSYQDVLEYPNCQMNWAADRSLAPTNPNKTIFNPNVNLSCGVHIMARQLDHFGKIVLKNGYWSTLESESQNSKIHTIQSSMRTLAFCNQED